MSKELTFSDKLDVVDALISKACEVIDREAFILGRHNVAFSDAIRAAEKAAEKAQGSLSSQQGASSDSNGSAETELRRRFSTIALLQSKEALVVHEDRTKALRLIEECKKLGDTILDPTLTHNLAYRINSDLGNKAGMLSAADSLIELEPDNVEYKVLRHKVEEMDEQKLKLGAFTGSWKVFAAFAVLAVIGLSTMSNKFGQGLVILLIAAGGSYWYWKSKTR